MPSYRDEHPEEFDNSEEAPSSSRNPAVSSVIAAEAEAKALNPSFVPLAVAGNRKYYQSRIAHAQEFIRQQKEEEAARGKMEQDLFLQFRSEFGQDGAETYFETYINQMRVGLVNIFLNANNDNYFLLGSYSGAGILGSMLLGSVTASFLRIGEINSILDFNEQFTTTTFEHPDTTAQGWGTGSLVFTTSGSVAIFNSWFNGSYYLTNFNKIRIDHNYIQYGGSGLKYEASYNGGSNYMEITPSVETTLTNIGSDFRLKITDPTGSLILTRIQIISKGNNFI